jgi:hypothetical protein
MRYFNYLSGAIGFLEPWTRNWIVDYKLEGEVAVLTFDNGKANAVSHALIDSLYEGFDRAEKEAKAIVMIGRPGIFSGGFDLKEIQQGPEAAAKLASPEAHTCSIGCSHCRCRWLQAAPVMPSPPVGFCC